MSLVQRAFGDIITFTRSSAATFFDATGTLQTAAIDAPRFDFNELTLAARGLRLESQRTNNIRNNTMQGAAAGTPGTLPTNWSVSGFAGLTRQIVGTSVVNGIECIDVRYSGTASGTFGNINFEAPTQIVAANAQTWSGSAWVQVISGSLSGLVVALTAQQRDSGGVFLSDTANGTASAAVGSTFRRITRQHTTNNAATAFIQPYLQFAITNGAAIDITLRIGLPQLERGAYSTSPIRTTGAAVARAADSAVINTLSPWFNPVEGTLFAEFESIAVDTRTVVDINDGTSNESIRLRTIGTDPFFTVTDNGSNVANIDAGTAAAGVIHKFAGSYSAAGFQSCINGGTVQTAPGATLPTLTQMLLGNSAAGNSLDGWLRRFVYYPRALSAAQLPAITV